MFYQKGTTGRCKVFKERASDLGPLRPHVPVALMRVWLRTAAEAAAAAALMLAKGSGFPTESSPRPFTWDTGLLLW